MRDSGINPPASPNGCHRSTDAIDSPPWTHGLSLRAVPLGSYKARDFAERHRLGMHLAINFFETRADPGDGCETLPAVRATAGTRARCGTQNDHTCHWTPISQWKLAPRPYPSRIPPVSENHKSSPSHLAATISRPPSVPPCRSFYDAPWWHVRDDSSLDALGHLVPHVDRGGSPQRIAHASASASGGDSGSSRGSSDGSKGRGPGAKKRKAKPKKDEL